MKNKKFSGFTVSEVLVALGIIGIIAALTVPSMITKYQRHAQLLQFNKVYSEFTQIMGLFAVNDNMGTRVYRSTLSVRGAGFDDASITRTAGRFLKNYFQIVSDCSTSTTPCFAASYMNLAGTAEAAFTCTGYAVTLESGSAVCIRPADTDAPAEVYVDTNGSKGPNISGRDIFHFNIYNDGTIDEGVTPEDKANQGTDTPGNIRAGVAEGCGNTISGDGCFARILNDNWKMDY